MITVIRPHDKEPELEYSKKLSTLKIFLAGTIDMGNSEDWQSKIPEYFKNYTQDVILYNPRRLEGFDSYDIEEMEYQINWELERLEKSSLIIMNILGTSLSPISLLELGLFARTGRLIVVCPTNYYRYYNVNIVCSRYNVPLFNTLEEALL